MYFSVYALWVWIYFHLSLDFRITYEFHLKLFVRMRVLMVKSLPLLSSTSSFPPGSPLTPSPRGAPPSSDSGESSLKRVIQIVRIVLAPNSNSPPQTRRTTPWTASGGAWAWRTSCSPSPPSTCSRPGRSCCSSWSTGGIYQKTLLRMFLEKLCITGLVDYWLVNIYKSSKMCPCCNDNSAELLTTRAG